MQLFKWIPVLLIVFTACSPKPLEEAEEPREDEYLYKASELNLFVDAINAAKEMEKPQIITTKPLLSFEIIMENKENRTYHLWITEEGEGFLQSLSPAENTTMRIKEQAVKPLKEYLASKENVELIQSDIEFEK